METAMADHYLHNFWPSKEEIANKEVEICVEVMPENYHNQSLCGAYPNLVIRAALFSSSAQLEGLITPVSSINFCMATLSLVCYTFRSSISQQGLLLPISFT
jgi:hypothetical protein